MSFLSFHIGSLASSVSVPKRSYDTYASAIVCAAEVHHFTLSYEEVHPLAKSAESSHLELIQVLLEPLSASLAHDLMRRGIGG